MKKYFALAIAAMLLSAALFSGCGPILGGDEPEPTPSSPLVNPRGAVSEAESEESYDMRGEMIEAYRAALTTLLNEHLLPDGTDCGQDDYSDPSDNQFALYDVDGDGRDELIFIYTTTYMAGMVQCIYDYDAETQRLTSELCEYPLLTLYDNGIIEAGWSHNQGLAGDFWPYSVYAYNADTDSYVSTGMVDAWDKNLAQTDYDGNPFPDDIDVSGTGVVYYVMTNGSSYENTAPVDVTEFEQWRANYLEGASTLDITFTALTEENIANMN